VGGSTGFAFRDTAGPSLAAGEKFVVALVQDEGMLYGYRNGVGMTAGTSTADVGTVTHAAPKLAARADGLAAYGTVGPLASISIPGQALTLAQLDDISAQLIAGTY
jgi:hypothetical protein